MGAGLILLCFSVLATVPVSAGESFTILDNQVAVRQAHLEWKSAILETKMESALSYLETLEGTDTMKLGSWSQNSEISSRRSSPLKLMRRLHAIIRDIAFVWKGAPDPDGERERRLADPQKAGEYGS
jgi:hypothetical protein